MTGQSKFSPTNWKAGGFGTGDFHVWVENPYGEVISDPVFQSYKNVCKFRGLDINKPRYQEWCAGYNPIPERMIKHWTGELSAEWYNYPMVAKCPLNALTTYLKNPDYYRLVVGSCGWGKKGLSNIVWYEFG
tara:strand:+ start:624 stop:1019 length:396 start_codon:yes stop_codon:yes gene_type:complete